MCDFYGLYKQNMRFQNQEKGLFTFYREQQLFQDHIEYLKKLKSDSQISSQSKKESPKTMKNVNKREKLINNVSLTSQPIIEAESHYQHKEKVRYKQYGEAVMIINRKNTEQSNKRRKDSQHQKEIGSYLQNKCIELNHQHKHSESKQHSGSLGKTKKANLKKREQYLRAKHQIRASTRLPSLCKIQQPDPIRSPTEAKHKINGSLIRSGGNDILKHIRVRAERETGLEKKSVSYFEFNREDFSDEKEKKMASLSLQQKKLLEILNRYRKV